MATSPPPRSRRYGSLGRPPRALSSCRPPGEDVQELFFTPQKCHAMPHGVAVFAETRDADKSYVDKKSATPRLCARQALDDFVGRIDRRIDCTALQLRTHTTRTVG